MDEPLKKKEEYFREEVDWCKETLKEYILQSSEIIISKEKIVCIDKVIANHLSGIGLGEYLKKEDKNISTLGDISITALKEFEREKTIFYMNGEIPYQIKTYKKGKKDRFYAVPPTIGSVTKYKDTCFQDVDLQNINISENKN